MSYIEREALKEHIGSFTGKFDDAGFWIDLQAVLRAIDFAPTADVVEVRHGEWKKVSEKYPRYVCTCCNHLYNNKEYKYYPNCGAKMDLERRSE